MSTDRSKDGGFDVVLINMAIMDIETLEPLADALPRLLKKNGMCVDGPDTSVLLCCCETDENSFVATMLHPVSFTSHANRIVEVLTDPTTGEYYNVRGRVIREYMKVAPWRGVAVNGQPAHQVIMS